MQQAGYNGTQRVVSFSGKTKKIHHHPLLKTIEFSTFHMNPDDLFSYWKRMQSYHPRFLSAYPSALSIFTNYLLKSKKQVPGLQAIFCHGETLTDNQRTLFENVYDCRIYDQYGHREQCVFATTCPESNLYHINPAYGYVEVIDKRGFPLTTFQEQGEIVATSLHNRLFPFIRYNTEDLAIISHKKCDCGRNFPLLERIIGRKQDFLITKENHPIPLTGLYHVIAESSAHIKECQLFQDTPGEVIVSIVTEKGFTDHDEHRIKKQFSNRFSDHFNLIIKPVESIPRTHGGKFRYLIQKLSYPIFD
jgi:phenylacetate-CoA ligase